MLRREQVEALAAPGRRALEERALVLLRRSHAAALAALGAEGAREEVRRGVARSLEHGITAAPDVLLFLGLRLDLGPAFDTELAWARDVLASDRPGSERVLALLLGPARAEG